MMIILKRCVVMKSERMLSGFFFQAEDGIRDLTVTGVQTCALPIFQKVGTGKWILTGSNSYNGGTLVSNGALFVNNISGSGTGRGDVEVGSGGTLGGIEIGRAFV